MSSEVPQVKKRFYTRLMDVYRYNDMYIPGFNIAARVALKWRAESAFRSSSSQTPALESKIQEFVQSKKFFFGYGMYRSGTTFLADFLNRNAKRSVVQHEANVNDYWFYAKAIQSEADALDYIDSYRKAEIYSRVSNLDFDVYGEINPFLRRHCAAINSVFPEAKQFQVVRDPRNVLRSLMSRELFSKKDPMAPLIHPPKSDPIVDEWTKMNRFEKLCWLWAADNRYIRQNTQRVVKFEMIRKDFEYFEETLLKFVGLQVNPDDWRAEAGQVFNSTPKYTFPKYAEWSAEHKKQFERLCGQEMANYGY